MIPPLLTRFAAAGRAMAVALYAEDEPDEPVAVEPDDMALQWAGIAFSGQAILWFLRCDVAAPPWVVVAYHVGAMVATVACCWYIRRASRAHRRCRQLCRALLEQPAIRDYAEGLDLPTVEEVTMGNL